MQGAILSGGAARGAQAPGDPDDPVAAAAIEWAVLMRSGEAREQDRAVFAAWRRADPRHEAAYARLEQALGAFGQLPGASAAKGAAHRALLAEPGRRKLLRGALGLALAGAGGAAVLHRYAPLQELTADLRTGTGERRRLRLADGSTLWLNARSAADVSFDAATRAVLLRRGELVVDVAPDAARPFDVHTPQGRMRALGTRFLVRREEEQTLLVVLHSQVRIDTPAGESLVVRAGQGARFGPRGIARVQGGAADAAAWVDGYVEVHDRPLGEVVAALAPYHPGYLGISKDAAALRVTGIYSLDDRRRTLAALAESLPITVRERTAYWVSISLN